ncbi:hypothetical protein [Deinococcus ruber]|uniref:RelA/SpoT domain-containing protein n=1 Tax=Deinococcus ruber TaxID=1848197 RepID=A0A918C6Z1_9DEIO|nr:hypothetical protein [Deinococcus ruber]GGR09961.1 hypothetical protein GCM10008957_23420 [Deinococcus ruber]
MSLAWTSTTGETLFKGEYAAFALLGDEQRVVLVGNDGVRLADLSRQEMLDTVAHSFSSGHKAVTFDAHGQRLYVAPPIGRTVEVFSLPNMRREAAVQGLRSSIVRLIAASKTRRLFASLQGGNLVQFDVRGKRPVSKRQVQLPHNGLALALSPDETLLAVGQQGKCALYRADSLTFIQALPSADAVWAVAFSPNGRFLAYGGGAFQERDGGPPGEQVHTDVFVHDLHENRVALHDQLHRGLVSTLAWHPTRALLASGGLDREIHLWSLESPEEATYQGTVTPEHFGANQLVFTPDGQHLLALTNKALEVFDMEGAPPLKIERQSTSTPLAQVSLETRDTFFPQQLLFREDQLWVSGTNQWFRVNLKTYAVEAHSPLFPHGLGVWLEPDAHLLARITGGDAPDTVKIEVSDLSGGTATLFSFPSRYSGHVHLSPDGDRLVYLNEKGHAFQVALDSSHIVREARRDVATVGLVDTGSPNPLFVTSSGFGDRQAVRLWNLDALTSTVVLRSRDFAPLAGQVASAVWHGAGVIALGGSEGGVGVVEMPIQRARFFRHRHNKGTVYSLAFNADATLLASAGEDGTVRIWDALRGDELATFEGSALVRVVAFSPDGTSLVGVDEKGMVYLWPLETATALLALTRPETTGIPSSEAASENQSERESYLARAREEGLSAYAEVSAALYERWSDRPRPRQSAPDLVSAYYEAHELLPKFQSEVEEFARSEDVRFRHRPDGVKSLDRVVEKMKLNTALIPIDLLGATVVCISLRDMYRVAERVAEVFDVVGFRDRMVFPVRSGYRDLQFSIRFGSHVAELKVVHELFADLDRYEHRMYEVQRAITAEFAGRELPQVENWVTQALNDASTTLYGKAWARVRDREGGAL